MLAFTMALLFTPPARAQYFLLRPVRTGGTLERVLGHPARPTRFWGGILPMPQYFNVILGIGSSRIAIVRGRGAHVETDELNFKMVSARADSWWTKSEPDLTLEEPVVVKIYIGGEGVLGPNPGRFEPVLLEIGDDVFEVIDPDKPGRRTPLQAPSPCGDRLVDA